jgi:lycopene cyclase domain-containing protein
MIESYTYLFINLAAVSVPVLFSFHPKLQFWKNFRPFFLANAITAVLFLLWDGYFTALKVWGFNDEYVTGIFIRGLPLEEILFFLCIPYACVFSYHCFGLWKRMNFKSITTKSISVLLSTALIVLAVIFRDQRYTAVTFTLLASFIISQKKQKAGQ